MKTNTEKIPWTFFDRLYFNKDIKLESIRFFQHNWGQFTTNMSEPSQLTSPLVFDVYEILFKSSQPILRQAWLRLEVADKLYYEADLWLLQKVEKESFFSASLHSPITIPPQTFFMLSITWGRNFPLKGDFGAALNGCLYRRIL